MVDWSETNKALLTDPANKESLAALVEFVASQSERTDQTPPDQTLAAKGRTIFETGTLNKGKLSASCVECHALNLRGANKPLGKEGSGPSLTEYGGAGWLTRFIADPGLPTNYGEHNHMPAFKTRISDRELDLLVRWMSGDYYHASPESETQTSQPSNLAVRP
jgi:ubiquinol-cytochrome c reductase cytochrome b subunit